MYSMKSITGAILLVASAVFYLARINAQQINFHSATKFASNCSYVLAMSGVALIIWGLISDIKRSQRQKIQDDTLETK
jgi:predicted phage tail protein